MKLEAPKANKDAKGTIETDNGFGPTKAKRDEELERVKAKHPRSKVYRGQFGSIITEHGVKA